MAFSPCCLRRGEGWVWKGQWNKGSSIFMNWLFYQLNCFLLL